MSSSTLVSAILALIFFQCLSTVCARSYGYASPDDVKSLLTEMERGTLRRNEATKRAPHNIDTRALHQFKNCYFSPIQCVLMERRRR